MYGDALPSIRLLLSSHYTEHIDGVNVHDVLYFSVLFTEYYRQFYDLLLRCGARWAEERVAVQASRSVYWRDTVSSPTYARKNCGLHNEKCTLSECHAGCHMAACCVQVLAAAVVGRRSLQGERGGQHALREAQALHRATKALCKVWTHAIPCRIPSRGLCKNHIAQELAHPWQCS